MPRAFRWLLLVSFAMVVAAPALLAQSDRPAKGWFRCDTNTGGVTIYATPFFDWTGMFDELQNAFQQHMLSKYGYTERVNCSMASPNGNTLATLQADMQRQYAQFRAQGKKIVEIPWTMASPGITLAYQCFGVAQVRRAGMPDSTYLLHSKIFRIAVGTQAELSLSWIDELKRLHPGWYFPSPGCTLLPADAAKHPGYLADMARMYASSKPKVMAIDWQYRPGAAAETEAEDKKPAYYCERITGTSKRVYMTPVRPADSSWERWDIQNAWQRYVQASLDKEALTGGCEAGTMKQETVARNGRKEQWINQGYTVRDVDWTYAPGASPAPSPAPPPAAAPASAPATPPAAPRSPGGYPTVDRFGRPLPSQTFYCQYLGLAPDASGKYPLYRNELFTMATAQGAVQNAWKGYIESTYQPKAPGNPMCAIVPPDPAQREATMKSFNLLTQPATQKVINVVWKP